MKEKILIDEMVDDKKIFRKDGDLEFLTMKEIVRAKEDRNRLTGIEGSSIIYKIDGIMNSVSVDFFLTEPDTGVEILASDNADHFSTLELRKEKYIPEFNEYKIFTSATYSSSQIPAGNKYIKIVLGKGIQIAKTEISYKD